MARQLRIEYPGALYHITNRGNERRVIFRDTHDRETFLETLSIVIERFEWLCHGYVQMDNHYHLLIETPKGILSRGMMQLDSIYAQKFNRRYQRVGHLFQGRFKCLLVEKETYLLELSRYMVLNPVRAGLVNTPEEWKWSSYQAFIGAIPKPEYLTIDWILSQFGEVKARAVRSYKEFVRSGYGMEFPEEGLVGQVILGSEKFLRETNVHLTKSGKDRIKEIPRGERYSTRFELEELFQRGMISGKSRDEIIYESYHDYDYTMREIGDYLGLHYATISRAVKKYEEKKKREKG
jgi:REP element-mobilizing transposase RayT